MFNRVVAFEVFCALTVLAGCSGSGDADIKGADSELGGKPAGNIPGFINGTGPIAPSNKLTSGTCPYSPAPLLMKRAICSCKDLDLAGTLETRATAGGNADVGVNGRFSAATGTSIAGSLVAHKAIGVAGEMAIRNHTATQGDAAGAGMLHVGGDLLTGGNIGVAGELDVGGTLRLSGHLMVAGMSNIGARGPYQTVAEPCGCDPSTFFDVATRVAAAKATNDNAKIGLSTHIMSIGMGGAVLPTGSYYFDEVTSVGLHTITVTGAVALHIDGDLTAVGAQNIKIAPGGSLDLFINGNLQSAGDLALGEGAQAGSFRLYVGGSTVVHAGAQEFHGLLYAPRATVAFAGGTVVHGAVFAQDLAYAGALIVDYRGASTPPPSTCQPESPSGGASGNTGGGSEPASSDGTSSPK